jgi:RHS repeat-associated protein
MCQKPESIGYTDSWWHFNFYRTYDSNTGRYLEPDPIGVVADPSLYAFALGSPLNRSDPLGLWSLPPPSAGSGFLGFWWNAPRWHYCRNENQSCPAQEPRSSVQWFSDNRGAHGVGNRSYRGATRDNQGFQCTYDKCGALVTDPALRGSFDFTPPPPPPQFSDAPWEYARRYVAHAAQDVFFAYAWGTGYCVAIGDTIPPQHMPPRRFRGRSQ